MACAEVLDLDMMLWCSQEWVVSDAVWDFHMQYLHNHDSQHDAHRSSSLGKIYSYNQHNLPGYGLGELEMVIGLSYEDRH